ncbi:MAG TPA: T9SS type A sorting domain-containing protein, partial [Bacteroidia bacterium]|nr:T9SS type A sorting domain-containing protein [Bacteroidia bacterium]
NTATLGTKAKSYVYASDPLDLTPIDNSDTANVTVTGSYDPNDKRVNPEGNITPSFVSAGNYLDYTINFQNTGTDTAFTVIIKDTISNFLDLSTFQFVASSKPVLIDINANIIDFKFYNILLPDSNVNEPGSHGFVSYRIKPKSTATLGDVIKNTAFIYFDFNSPIVTNTTSTPIQLVTGLEDYKYENIYKLYPNPTAYSLFLSSKSEDKIAEVKIYNAEGRLVQVVAVNANEAEINVSGLASGLYVMSFQIGDTHITKKFIKH